MKVFSSQLSIVVCLAMFTLQAFAVQDGSLTGTVKDQTGGFVPKVKVTVIADGKAVASTTTGATGTYALHHLPPGSYTVQAEYSGLRQKEEPTVTIPAAQTAHLDLVMLLEAQKQQLNVVSDAVNQVSTDAASNVSALVLREDELASLPDDPDDLQADLEALAGPSAGPAGSQLFIDGFTGGRLPPKSSIREVRINSNPFSAEYDKLGFGRIEVFTKPGSDKFHGQGYYGTSDGIWNSRNPFLSSTPDFRSQLFGGNVSGPITRKASFFVDFDRRAIDDNGIINATTLNPATLLPSIQQIYYPTPQRRTTLSPRVDYQLAANDTLSLRYAWLDNNQELTGVSGFNLPGSGYSQRTTENMTQLVNTAVLSPSVINETRFQWSRDSMGQKSQSDTAQLNVANSFVSGGSGYSAAGYSSAYDVNNQYELQNYTSVVHGTHNVKAGIRIRAGVIDDYSPKNFNGAYVFQGTNTLSSLEQYRQTLLLLQEGLTSEQVAALGYGPSLYRVSSGQPYIGLHQLDFGPFVQDDWRLRPNFTLSLGLRWEGQTNINDKNDWAPRVGFAWAPKLGNAKTVIRGGWGIFYDRFAINNVLSAYRYNGTNQENYVLYNPTVFDSTFSTALSPSLLTLDDAKQLYQIDSSLHAPSLMQTVVSVERQLFSRTNLSASFVNSRGTHLLRTVDINAPIPGTYDFGAVTSSSSATGIRPFGNVGDIYNYESTGILKQTQLMVSVNSAFKWGSLFSRYAYGHAHADTDGITSLPANQYDLTSEYGRSSLDVRHMLFLGGSFTAPGHIQVSPFFVAHTGIPFNITTGTDLYLTGQAAATARPSVVSSAGANVIQTPYGLLNIVPTAGQTLITRNAGNGPGFLEMNMRISRTWGFGTTKFEGQAGGATARQGGGPPGGPGGGGPPGGGPGGGGPPPGGGSGGPGGGGPPRELSSHRYSLTLSLMARNALNHANLNTPNGAVTSQYFLQSTGITGGFGPEATASNQRRIDLQLRFSF